LKFEEQFSVFDDPLRRISWTLSYISCLEIGHLQEYTGEDNRCHLEYQWLHYQSVFGLEQ